MTTPNLLLMQVDSEWLHRPVRYRLTCTSPFEGETHFSKYVFVVPCKRESSFYVQKARARARLPPACD